MALEKEGKEALIFEEFGRHNPPKLKPTYFRYLPPDAQISNPEQSIKVLSVMARKMYVDNLILRHNLSLLVAEDQYLKLYRLKIPSLSALKNPFNESGEQVKKRRNRRNADEINRLYKCKVLNCSKSYGSQGTLAQHYKAKHPQIEYQKMHDSSGSGSQSSISLLNRQQKGQ